MDNMMGRRESQRARIVGRAVEHIVDARNNTMPHLTNIRWMSSQFDRDSSLCVEIIMFHLGKNITFPAPDLENKIALVVSMRNIKQQALELQEEVKGYLASAAYPHRV